MCMAKLAFGKSFRFVSVCVWGGGVAEVQVQRDLSRGVSLITTLCMHCNSAAVYGDDETTVANLHASCLTL